MTGPSDPDSEIVGGKKRSFSCSGEGSVEEPLGHAVAVTRPCPQLLRPHGMRFSAQLSFILVYIHRLHLKIYAVPRHGC